MSHISNKSILNRHSKRQIGNAEEETEQKKFFVIPYINKISEMIVSSVKNTEFITGYRCINKLDKIIKTQKDKNEQPCTSNVVYKINCKDCNASYVGQTKRQLQTRMKEHINNIKLDSARHSVISAHILNEHHSFDWDNVRILDSETNYYKRLISEMLHIKEQKNGLNLNKDTELLSESYFDILEKLANI